MASMYIIRDIHNILRKSLPISAFFANKTAFDLVFRTSVAITGEDVLIIVSQMCLSLYLANV